MAHFVVHGVRGSGKTQYLRHLEQLCSTQGPCAYIDVGPDRPARPENNLKLLTELVFKLEKKTYRWPRRLRFSRFRLGLLSLGANLNEDHHSDALVDLRRILSGGDDDDQEGAAQDFDQAVLSTTNIVAQAMGAATPPGTTELVRLVLRHLAPKTADGLRWRSALKWHAANARPAAVNGYDALVELNRMHKDGYGAAVDDLLCRAFLADIHAGYNTETFHWDRSANCLILLDNVDWELGEPFQEALGRAQEDAAASAARAGKKTRGPLVVAMTKRTPPPATQPVVASARVLDKVVAGTRASPGHRSLVIRLDDLQLPEIRRLMGRSTAALRGSDVALLVSMLTRGHSGGTALIADAMEAATRHSPNGFADPRLLLDLPAVTRAGAAASGTPAPSVADQILDVLLAGQPPEIRHAFITCAPALEPAATRALEGVAGLTRELVKDLHEILSAELWSLPLSQEEINARQGVLAEPPGGTSPDGTRVGRARRGTPANVVDRDRRLVSHRLLWRVLMHKLASRPAGSDDCWQAVHERLRDHHAAQGDTLAALHHALALGDLTAVVDHFETAFQDGARSDRSDVWQDWFDDLRYVARSLDQARARPLPGRPSPGAQVVGLIRDSVGSDASGTEERRLIARLTAALLIFADPLGDPASELRDVIADALTELAFRAGAGFEHLNMLARAFAAREIRPDQI
ncbi:hypothetical protein [Actinomadura sp. 6N118]|uniref:hypothetical protein n=1 Tax=Actinomadura sp. 6N118 TaxID=3375151 RepID=UPI0037AFDCBF